MINLWSRNRFSVLAAVAAWLVASGPRDEGVVLGAKWLTGTDLKQALAQPAGVVWAGTPLRQALEGLAEAHSLALVVDRRVDPGQELEFVVQDVPLGQLFEQAAGLLDLGVTFLGPVVYFGPPHSASRLRTLAALRREDARKLPSRAGRRWLIPKPFQWSDFATPRGLVERLADEGRFEVIGLENVPHDLWAAADLAPLDLADRLTLVLAQFDLTFEISGDGTAVRLGPVPEEVAVVRSYPGGTHAARLAQQWASLVPEAEIRVRGSTIWVRGLVEDHDRLTGRSRADAQPLPRPAEEEHRYTLNLRDHPVGDAIRYLSRQVGVELQIDHEAVRRAGLSLDTRVTVSVNDATAEQLFGQIAAAAGLTARRAGDTIRIGPAE